MTFNIPLFFINTGHLSCERVSERGNSIATVCSFPCPSPTTREPLVISSGHHFRPNFVNPIWREPEEPNLPLLPAANESRERHLFKAPPLNPPARRYLTRPGGRPLQKRARVESLEPIDLTNQSPVPSPGSSEPLAELQEHQPPLSKSQIPSGIAPEVLIRRPMLTQPPIEGNLDC